MKKYLNASDVPEKESFMSDAYRAWFREKKGEGEDKKSALATFQNWDCGLHPDVSILKHQHKGKEWQLLILEQNDFSKIIDFPGWKARVHITMDHHKIRELIYILDTLNPDYKKWLNPAVEWLQQNKAGELEKIYKNGRLTVRSEATAREWIRLLRLWKENSR